MKTVTIPTCDNPFSAIVNGKKYTYEAGKTVGVPDEVAAVIQAHRNHHDSDANSGSGSLFKTITAMASATFTYIDENMEVRLNTYLSEDWNEITVFGGVLVSQEERSGCACYPCDLYDTGTADCYLCFVEDGATVS